MPSVRHKTKGTICPKIRVFLIQLQRDRADSMLHFTTDETVFRLQHNTHYLGDELHTCYAPLANNISLVKLRHIDQNHEFHPPDLSMGSGDSYAWCFGVPIRLNRLAIATLAVATLFSSLAPIATTLGVADT
jgi:hypothetical protein